MIYLFIIKNPALPSQEQYRSSHIPILSKAGREVESFATFVEMVGKPCRGHEILRHDIGGWKVSAHPLLFFKQRPGRMSSARFVVPTSPTRACVYARTVFLCFEADARRGMAV